jgi:hypothetical protein
MSGGDSGHLTPYGLTTLDIATGNVLRRFEVGDWEGSLISLKILAYTTGDEELIRIAERHAKETIDYKARFKARKTGITQAENYSSDMELQGYVQNRALDLFKQLRISMKGKKLISMVIEPRYGSEGTLGK